MVNKKTGFLKAAVPFGLLFVGVVVGMLYLSTIQEPIIEQAVHMRRVPTLVTGDGNPGDGVTGFFYYAAYPHQADPGTAYASNLSNATAYEYSDTGDNNACTGWTPYATTFDLVVKVGVNNSDGYNITAAAWDDTYMWMNLTCANLTIGADTDMTEIEIAAQGTVYRYMHYYLNNGGAGYTIDVGDKYNVTSVKFGVLRPV